MTSLEVRIKKKSQIQKLAIRLRQKEMKSQPLSSSHPDDLELHLANHEEITGGTDITDTQIRDRYIKPGSWKLLRVNLGKNCLKEMWER